MNSVKKLVHAEEVYQIGLSGENVRIALLDTGVAEHPDIKKHIRLFKDYVNGKNYCYDDNGHGTHIAGILCGDGSISRGDIQGMAPKAELYVFKILDKNGNGRTEDALKAMDWLLEHHKQYSIRLLNFSMGYRPDAKIKLQERLMERMESLWNEGVIIITAAGNNGPKDNTITIPGISRKVITVGACGKEEMMKQSLEDYSGRGPTGCCIVKPEILAPGTDIISLSSIRYAYTKKSGTSMAVPVVCGGLALALEQNSKILPEEMKLYLYESVDRDENIKNKFWGVLNVDKLIKML